MHNEYIIKEAKSGAKTLTFKTPESEIRIHSAYDPEKEAARSTEKFSAKPGSVILVSGAGLGYHLKYLKRKFPDHIIIAAESDPQLLKTALKTCPENFKGITICSDERDLPEILEGIDITLFKGISSYTHNPSYKMDPEFYDNFFKEMSRFISSRVSDLLTRFEFEEKWALNILRNTGNLLKALPVKNIFGAFRGYPGIIVSAGPSLRKNVKVLQNLRKKAVIVCVDTALKVLDRHGIEPHFVMTLDAQKHSVKHFFGLKKILPPLIADAVSCPAILRDYKGIKIAGTTTKFHTAPDGTSVHENTPLMDWFQAHSGTLGDIQSGGSVATSAFDLLLSLGCSQIILAGQDLAYTGREIHASGTHHNDGWLAQTTRFLNLDTINQKVVRKRKIKHVEAFGGNGTVVSDFVFDLYKSWFEDSAARVKIRVINSTEGGAKIKNCEETELEELARTLPSGALTPDEILTKVLSSPVMADEKKTMNALSEIRRKAQNFYEKSSGMTPEDAVRMINEEGLYPVLRPFLKKTETILTRRDADQEEYNRVIAKDAAAACQKIIKEISGISR